jgi:hypothetical protein
MTNRMQNIIDNYIENLTVLETYIIGLEDMLAYQKEKFSDENLSDKSLGPIFEAMAMIQGDLEITDKIKKVEEINSNFEYGEISFDGEAGISVKIKERFIQKRLVKTVNELHITSRQVPMIFTSSLINLAVYFELLTTQLLKERLLAYPGSMNIKEKTLTISEIEEIGTLEEAKRYLIDQEVDGIMHGGLKSWFEYFEKRMKVDFSHINEYVEEINEVFCRRHLFVHNGGVVNNIYLTRVARELRSDLNLGDELVIKEDYLIPALQLFKKVGILLGLEIWKKQDKTSEERALFLLNYIFDLLIEEESELALILCSFVLKDNNVNSQRKWVAQMNLWLSYKQLGRFDEIKHEVEEADLSALSNEFQLCRLALLNKKEEFFQMIEQQGYPNSILTLHDLDEWPIFKELRKEPEYHDFIKKHEGETVSVSND